MPKDSDFTALEVSLNPLHDVTDVLASEKQVTLSLLKTWSTSTLRYFKIKRKTALTKQMNLVIREDLLMQLQE